MILAALVLFMLVRVDAFHRLSRTHRDRVAAAIVEARRVGEPIPGLDNQALRLLVDGCDLGTRALDQGLQTAAFDAPAECWHEGRNLVVLQLRKVGAPSDDLGLPRAAAVDWIEITPLAASRTTGAAAGSSPPADAGRR